MHLLGTDSVQIGFIPVMGPERIDKQLKRLIEPVHG
jgi:hypothetical protein